MTIIDRLKETPHLKLPITVDVSGINAEVFGALPDLVPFSVPYHDAMNERFNLSVAGIFDVVRDHTKAGTYLPALRQLDPGIKQPMTGCSTTEYGDGLPITVNALLQIGEQPARCKLSRLPPGKAVPAHKHPHKMIYNEQIIHIALKTNPDVAMVITNDNGIEFRQHYAVGEVWIFNNWFFHSVENNGQEDRYHLWLNYFLFDQNGNRINTRLWSLIEQALGE